MGLQFLRPQLPTAGWAKGLKTCGFLVESKPGQKRKEGERGVFFFFFKLWKLIECKRGRRRKKGARGLQPCGCLVEFKPGGKGKERKGRGV